MPVELEGKVGILVLILIIQGQISNQDASGTRRKGRNINIDNSGSDSKPRFGSRKSEGQWKSLF